MLPLLTGYFRVIRAQDVDHEAENKQRNRHRQIELMYLNLRSLLFPAPI